MKSNYRKIVEKCSQPQNRIWQIIQIALQGSDLLRTDSWANVNETFKFYPQQFLEMYLWVYSTADRSNHLEASKFKPTQRLWVTKAA